MNTWQASRAAALARLESFVPAAGSRYARDRNSDFGPDRRDNVSCLSPWLRYRLISERELLARVLAEHSPNAAEKFIQEVLWRTYWKGWLEQRPAAWRRFLDERDHQHMQVQAEPQLGQLLRQAEQGQTGIEGFDDWARELVRTGHLHNHARMWFASIWIFTLKLPWTLGADFFLRHLLDADPASNTLSWRWVAGLLDDEGGQELVTVSCPNGGSDCVEIEISQGTRTYDDRRRLVAIGLAEEDMELTFEYGGPEWVSRRPPDW